MYWEKSVEELKDIKMGEPSGVSSRFIKNDYLTAIKNYLDNLALIKSII